MAATLLTTNRITISDRIVDEACDTPPLTNASLVLRTDDGAEVNLPRDLQRVLLGALTSLANDGEVTICRMPEELTSTVTADLLGVSRPTLMKWVHDDEISSFKVGTHTRFRRDEVLRVRDLRAKQRRAAFDELRSLDEAPEELFVD
ncbi:helix-turn-helix domain-containing protein [Brachybacterium sp. 107]|uniref:helix-turn-helix domain-containing protein n=1 Tax=Brachybacterium sp. 107 TaxID=3457736 RepID=UPI004034C44A